MIFVLYRGGEKSPRKLVTPAGIEPATPDLEGRCSIQLSYGVMDRLRVLPKTRMHSNTTGGKTLRYFGAGDGNRPIILLCNGLRCEFPRQAASRR